MPHSLRDLCFTLATLAFIGVSSLEAADDDVFWPGWMGPQRNGWVSTFQPPAKWPDKLEQVWSIEVGSGYGSPLVDGGRIYQHARQQDMETLWCVETATGKVVWRQASKVPFTASPGGERHGTGPKSSPALADGRIFTMSIVGTLTAWNADDGRLLWQRDERDRFEQAHPNWGASTSPLVVGERVIVHFGGDDVGELTALDVETGETVWSSGTDGASYSSPLPAEFHDVQQVVEWNHRALVGVDADTGEQLWEYPFPHVGSDQNMPTPTIHDELIVLGGENRGMHGLQPVLQDGTWSVNERWHLDDLALDMSSAVISDGHLYGFSHYDSGRLFCLDPQTGDVKWTSPGRTGQNVMFLAFPGHVAALINDGELRILAATPEEYRPVASYRVSDNQTWAPPVMLPDSVLVKDQQRLVRWGLGE